jgi:hypothetical protein
VRCQIGTLQSGASATVTIAGKVTAAGSSTNIAIGISELPDGSLGNNGSLVGVDFGTGPTTEPPGPKEDDHDKDEERQRERRERVRQKQEEEETQGNVLAVRCNSSAPANTSDVAGDDGEDVPYVIIRTIDGNQKVRLHPGGARRACPAIRVGDYLEANGEKVHEHLFDVDDVKIRH